MPPPPPTHPPPPWGVLRSVPWGGMAGMKGLLSSCSSGSSVVASPSQQTNSQCWAQARGGGAPPPVQLAMATAQPGALASPGVPLAQSWCFGVLAGLREPGCSAHSPHSPRPAPGWPHGAPTALEPQGLVICWPCISSGCCVSSSVVLPRTSHLLRVSWPRVLHLPGPGAVSPWVFCPWVSRLLGSQAFGCDAALTVASLGILALGVMSLGILLRLFCLLEYQTSR